MPGPDDPEEQRQRAQAWLAAKWSGSKRCPICDSNEWTVTETRAIPLYLRRVQTTASQRSDVFPAFLVICEVCGYTLTFSAVIAGLFDEKPTDG